jgi:multidrug efflux pump subunit AcrA (membrane-fusion protein)
MYRSWNLSGICQSKLARLLPLTLLAVFAILGCGHHHQHEVHSVAEPPTVQVVQPETRDIATVVGQPSFVEAYERTSVYPKLAGYIEKWYVDIGDTVKKDQVMADLFVPEIIEEWKRKGALVEFDRKRVKLAERTVDVAAADVEVAEAPHKFAKATWEQYRKEVIRWASEVNRLQREVHRGVVDPQVLLESENRFRGSTAARDSAEADVAKAESNLESAKAGLSEAQVAVKVAQADVDVADSDYKRLGAWADNEPGQKRMALPYGGLEFTARGGGRQVHAR